MTDEQIKALKLIRKRLKNRISAREHAKKQQQQVGEARMGSQILQQNHARMQEHHHRLQVRHRNRQAPLPFTKQTMGR